MAAKADTCKLFWSRIVVCGARYKLQSNMYRNFAKVILNEVQHISGLPLSTKTQLEGYICLYVTRNKK